MGCVTVMPAESPPLLDVRDLRLNRGDGAVVLHDLSLSLQKGEILGVVGESGSGKSQLLLTLLGLAMPGSTASGSARLNGQELIGATEGHLRTLRGNRMAMLFQDPMTALNPYRTVAAQLIEAVRCHQQVPKAQARSRAREALHAVEMPEPDRQLEQYPHQLSGGMRQRVMLAMALLCTPDLLLADEPTTALDVTTQAQVLDLLLALRGKTGMGILLVTHDLGVVARIADRVMVMHAGVIVETGSVDEVLAMPQSAHARELVAAARRLESAALP
jgi:ABC-type glutathione transport system ATPase component